MKPIVILGIESSCDETASAVISDGVILSNVIAGQEVHRKYGGVVPELASRAHQQNIVPVVEEALKRANINKNDLDAIAFTRGPGLMGSLLVGTSFAKGLSISLNIPLIEVNHIESHVFAHFIKEKDNGLKLAETPFICLTVSGGHTQIVMVNEMFEMKVIGQTQDDAAGEAFDKVAKMLGFEYPGGPQIDKLAKEGDPYAYKFPEAHVPGYSYSFSGLKTSVLYFLQNLGEEQVKHNIKDICASVQYTIIKTLLNKVRKAAEDYGIKRIAIAGGVSANSGLRNALLEWEKEGYEILIPKFEYTTDNAAMIATTGYYKYLRKEFCPLSAGPFTRI